MSLIRSAVGKNIRSFYSMMTSRNVLHKEGKFYIDLEKGQAMLEYDLNNGVMDMYHTEVPTAYRGQGLAKSLVEDALKYAETKKLKVKPTCSYVLKYVNDNPDSNIRINTV